MLALVVAPPRRDRVASDRLALKRFAARVQSFKVPVSKSRLSGLPSAPQIHLPYHESDHVLNLAYNALCDGTCLQDLELRRQDEVYLDALGARRIPDPTTAGDFCRRFRAADVHTLIDIANQVRQRVWARQPAAFFEEATIDMDGTLVETTGACKAGMDIAYDGTWGYHPLVVSLADTGEVLSVLNRPA